MWAELRREGDQFSQVGWCWGQAGAPGSVVGFAVEYEEFEANCTQSYCTLTSDVAQYPPVAAS